MGLFARCCLSLRALVGSIIVSHVAAAVVTQPLLLEINISTPSHHTAAEYVSFNFDYHYDGEEFPAWVNSSVLNMTLAGDENLTFLATSLSPAYLRVGGSEGDMVQYIFRGASCNTSAGANVTFCLTPERWAEINAWARTTGLKIAFGVNAMTGRVRPNASMNLSNLDTFLAESAAAGLDASNTLPYLEFGNEKQEAITAAAYAADVLRVRALIDTHWAGVPASLRPKLVRRT